MLGLRMYSCSLFEQFCPPKFPFLLWLKLLVCCTIESDRPADRWMKIMSTLFASPYKFGAPDCILGSWFGSYFGPCFGFHFGRGFGALDFVCNCRGPNRCPKMEPETGTKIWPKSGPQNAIRGPKFVRRCKQALHDLHSAVCLAILFNCATNQQLQPKKEGKLGRAKLLKQRAWIHSQTKHSQDMFYLQKIHSQVSRMGKSTACLLPWGYAHASPQNCLFWGPGFGTSFCSILRPLLATLLHPWVAEFAASILSLEDAKCEIASLSNTCGLHMFKQWSNNGAIYWAGQWNRGTKFRYGGILRIVAKMLASPVHLLSNVDL